MSVPEVLPGRRRGASPGATPAVGIVAAVAVAGLVLVAVTVTLRALGASEGLPAHPYTVTNLVIGPAHLVCAGLLGWHHPRNLLVLVLAAGGFGHLLSAAGQAGVALGEVRGWPGALLAVLAALWASGWLFGLGGGFTLLLLLYPDGRLPSPRWRAFTAAYLAFLGARVVAQVVRPESALVTGPGQIVDTAATLVVVAGLVRRYRRGDEKVRGQILWLLLAVLVIVALNLQRALTGLGPEVFLLSFLCVPAAMVVGIVRHQLLDIRLVVSWALLYGTLLAILAGAYVGLVVIAGRLAPGGGPSWGPAVAALAAALLLDPVRTRLRRVMTRAFYGSRDRPMDAVARLGGSIGEAEDIGDVLEQARRELRLPALGLRDATGRVVADARAAGGTDVLGSATSGATVQISLACRAEPVGRLDVTLRPGERALHHDDRIVLSLMTGPLALLLREQALAEALRASRAQVVRAREGERAVLHRDLHDGLGPTLTDAAFRTDAAARLLRTDAERSLALLAEVRRSVSQALDEVRRVVYGLRPLALEGHDVAGALRERAAGGRLAVRVEACDLPPLSAAVELAAYRIGVEAITNAQRHSTGQVVQVRVGVHDGTLHLEVHDDGTPPAGTVEGVGLRSMRERAEELGGRAQVRTGPQGWSVVVAIPAV